MIKSKISLLLLLFITLSCSKTSNNSDFIKSVSGKYLFNPNKAIEVYFIENELFLKWNGAENIKPLKTDDSTFYVKEMNEKIQFLTNPEDGLLYICLVSKDDKSKITYNY